MIGLKYIMQIYRIGSSELAQKMNTTPQNVNTWLNETRKISEHRLEQLNNIFPNIPKGYFLEVTEDEKTEIKMICLRDFADEFGFEIEIKLKS